MNLALKFRKIADVPDSKRADLLKFELSASLNGTGNYTDGSATIEPLFMLLFANSRGGGIDAGTTVGARLNRAARLLMQS